MRTSLASGVALSVPTFFSGLIRAHGGGGGGGGGGQTTTDPWGTTECTDQTTHETTWATTQETTLPETTVDTTVELPPKSMAFRIDLYIHPGYILKPGSSGAHVFTFKDDPAEDNPGINVPGIIAHHPDPESLPKVIDGEGETHAVPFLAGTPNETHGTLRNGYPISEPQHKNHHTEQVQGGYLHFYRLEIVYHYKYD